jgi:hypothetical protein
VFPVTHAVTDDYISFWHKNMPLVSATSFSRTKSFDGANIRKISDTVQNFAK